MLGFFVDWLPVLPLKKKENCCFCVMNTLFSSEPNDICILIRNLMIHQTAYDISLYCYRRMILFFSYHSHPNSAGKILCGVVRLFLSSWASEDLSCCCRIREIIIHDHNDFYICPNEHSHHEALALDDSLFIQHDLFSVFFSPYWVKGSRKRRHFVSFLFVIVR